MEQLKHEGEITITVPIYFIFLWSSCGVDGKFIRILPNHGCLCVQLNQDLALNSLRKYFSEQNKTRQPSSIIKIILPSMVQTGR